ncbi:MAG: YhbY family RNA-binding protein [Pseudomonadota bacterium]
MTTSAQTAAPLSEHARKRLRALGHALKPVILIGEKGVSDSLLAECERALTHHELLKIKARGRDKQTRDSLFGAVCDATGAVLVQRIGSVGLIYRPNPEQPRIDVS